MGIKRRHVLEAQVEALEEELQAGEDNLSWVKDQRLEDYIEALGNLANYIGNHNMLDRLRISPFVVASYLKITRLLQAIITDSDLKDYHKVAKRRLELLNYNMDILTNAADTAQHVIDDLKEEIASGDEDAQTELEKLDREKPCTVCGNVEFAWGNLSMGQINGNRNKVYFREFGMTYDDGDMPIHVRRCRICNNILMFIHEHED